MTEPRPRRFPIVLAGPSGSGKTTVGHALVERRSDVVFSVSATTREARAGEVDGDDYHFLTRDRFRELVERDAMLEYAEVHGEWYGTPRRNLAVAREADSHLLLDIDVQGARQVRDAVPEVVRVFLLPPSGDRIVERLRGRGTEDEAELRERLRRAEAELAAIGEFDYAMVNDEWRTAVATLDAIITAEEGSIPRLGETAIAWAGDLAREIKRALG